VTYTIDVKELVLDSNGDYIPEGILTPPINRKIFISRDGSEYNNIIGNVSMVQYSEVDKDLSDKFIMQERYITNKLLGTIEGSDGLTFEVGSEDVDIEVGTIFDIFIPDFSEVNETIQLEYNDMGLWDANNEDHNPPSLSPNHRDYWVVSNAGNIELSGIVRWEKDDVIVWNDITGLWEKNNAITGSETGEDYYKLNHDMVIMGKEPFEGDNTIDTEYDENCGLFFLRMSETVLPIDSTSDIISNDSNPINSYGKYPTVVYIYKNTNRDDFIVHSIRTDLYEKEHSIINVTRMLRNFPRRSSSILPYNIEISDKHLIVYGTDSTFPEIKSSTSSLTSIV